jgi:hypothetical protein
MSWHSDIFPVISCRCFAEQGPFTGGNGHLVGRFLLFVDYFFLQLYFCFFCLDSLADQRKHAHVQVSDPYQGEACDQVAPPAREQQGITGNNQKKDRYIVAEAIFAGQHIKAFPQEKAFILFALAGTVGPHPAEDLFMGNCPGNTANRDRQYEKPYKLGG